MTTKAGQLKRYGEIARLLLRNRDAIGAAGEPDALVDDEDSRKQGEQLAADLEAMGPTFVKLGQVLSTRSDLLPPSHLEALSRLQDEVAPFDGDEARRIVEDELGAPVRELFAEFSDDPLASASLGQVHRARLADGRAVVVKIQRPGAESQVAADLAALSEIARLVDNHTETGRQFGFVDLLEQFRRTLSDELDYRHEASNLVRLGEVVEDEPRLVVPAPVVELTTRRVLTMDEVRGDKVTELAVESLAPEERTELADALVRAYLEQIFVHGFFHADPHPGNVLVTPEHQLGIVDLGMVGHIRAVVRTELLRMLLAVEDGRGQDVGEVLASLGRELEDFEEEQLLRHVAELVSRRQGARIEDLRLGEFITELSQACGMAGLRPPIELALLARALMNLEGVTRSLDPDYDHGAAIRRHAATILAGQMRQSGGVLSALVEARDFAEQLPSRVNRVMEALAHGEFRVKVHAFDEAEMLRSITKIANRLAMGLVIAALVLGAAVMSKAYPSIALGCFIAAAVCGLALMGSIVLADRELNARIRRRRRR